MRNRIIATAAFVLPLLIGASRLHADSRIEFRRHYVVVTATGANGEVTVLKQMVEKAGEDEDLDTYLFEASTGDRFIFENNFYYAKSKTELVIRDVRGDSRITATFTLPFPGQRRDEFFAEAFRNVRLFEYMSGVTIETRGGTWSVSRMELESNGPHRTKLASEIRRTISFELLEMIERAAMSVFATELAAPVRVFLVDALLYRSGCESKNVDANLAMPDCRFDERFGFRCSEKQNDHAKAAIEAGEIPERY
ncbi:MAG: hypothetical protein ACYC7A_09085 [Thermoanaerobaculia bacterium]